MRPKMLCRGVRSSWFMTVRKSLRAATAISARSRATSSA